MQSRSKTHVQVIEPYYWNGEWVFDDPETGLEKEGLVRGIDTMIELMTADIPNARDGCRLLFSDQPFRGHTLELEWRSTDASSWHCYYSPQLGTEGWLCRNLLKYFAKPPKRLYARVEPLPGTSTV